MARSRATGLDWEAARVPTISTTDADADEQREPCLLLLTGDGTTVEDLATSRDAKKQNWGVYVPHQQKTPAAQV